MRGLGLGFTNLVVTGGVLYVCLSFGCGGVGGELVGGLDQGLVGLYGVMSVLNVSPDFLCRWQVQVSLYIVLGGYLRILGAPNVQSCSNLWISAS